MLRALTNMGKFTEAPPSAEAPAKPTRAIRRERLRPMMSPIRPPRSNRLPKASEYPVTTHCRSALEKLRACWAVGNAMLTMVLSRITISWATPSTARIHQRRASLASRSETTATAAVSVFVMHPDHTERSLRSNRFA